MTKFDKNPYNFVSLAEGGPWLEAPGPARGKHQGHDRWLPKLLHGSVSFKLVAKTPVFVPEGFPVRPTKENDLRTIARHFCRMRRRAAGEQVCYAIPGSALKGALRSMVEALTQDRFGVADDGHGLRIPYRRRGFQVGRLEKTEDGGWAIRPHAQPQFGEIDRSHPMFLLARESRARLPHKLKPKGNAVALPLDSRVVEEYIMNLKHPHYERNYEFARKEATKMADAQTAGDFAAFDAAESVYAAGNKTRAQAKAMAQARTPLREADKCWYAKPLPDFDDVIKNLALLEVGTPVYYCCDAKGKVASFGRSAHYLWPAAHSPYALAPDFFPPKKRSLESDLGMAERMFGFISNHGKGSHPFRGKVRVETAWGPPASDEKAEDGWDDRAATENPGFKLQLGPLTSPENHAKSRPLYLKPKQNGESASYSDPEPELRGRKFYWNQRPPGGEAIPREHKPSAEELRDSAGQLPPPLCALKPETRFECRVSFENLSPVELGALLFALGENSGPEHAIHIGKAKPRGLGVCGVDDLRLTVERPEERYGSFQAKSGREADEGERGTFVAGFRAWCEGKAGGLPFSELGHIRDFIALHRWPASERRCHYHSNLPDYSWMPREKSDPDEPRYGPRPEAMGLARDLDPGKLP